MGRRPVLPRTEKPCSKCRLVKPLSAYPKNRRGRDGHHSNCKVCHTKTVTDLRVRRARAGCCSLCGAVMRPTKHTFQWCDACKDARSAYWASRRAERMTNTCCDCQQPCTAVAQRCQPCQARRAQAIRSAQRRQQKAAA